MHCTALCSLTIIFETVPVCLRLKRTESDFASIAQDSALTVADLNPIDLRQSTPHQKHARHRSEFNVRRFHL